ncbi:cystatin [Loa loa]|uniref:Cystatin n=1 Tax=Loa loa TaxID=7209 RepID=A0A1S0U9X8_LOALO|nr:cystatin [Loa loa]EFO27414.1 cystatin [Loa loa]
MLEFVLLLTVFISFSSAQYENDPDVQDVVRDSMIMINDQMRGKSLYKLGKILKAKVLVVQNAIYQVTLLLIPTTCPKHQKVQNLSQCPVDRRQRQQTVNVKITESLTGEITVKVG